MQVVNTRAVSIGRYPLDGNGATWEPPTKDEVLRITGDKSTQGTGAVAGMSTQQPIVSVDTRGWVGIGTVSPGAPFQIVAQSSSKASAITYGNPDMWGKHIIDGAQQMWGEKNLYGRLFTWGSDSLFVGLQSREPAQENKQDAIIAWGDDPDDSLRFVHVPHWSPGNETPNASTECLRLTAAGSVGLSKRTPAAETRLHIGGENSAPDTAKCEPAMPDVVVTKKGFVGIGTASPETPLHIFIDTPADPLKPEGLWGRQIRDGVNQIGSQSDVFGRSICWDSDHIFFGLKNLGENRKDAIISWGDDESDELSISYSGGPTPQDCLRLTSKGQVLVGVDSSSKFAKNSRMSVNGRIHANSLVVMPADGKNAFVALGPEGILTNGTISAPAISIQGISTEANVIDSEVAEAKKGTSRILEQLLINGSRRRLDFKLSLPIAEISKGNILNSATIYGKWYLCIYSSNDEIYRALLGTFKVAGGQLPRSFSGSDCGYADQKIHATGKVVGIGYLSVAFELILYGAVGAAANVFGGNIEVL